MSALSLKSKGTSADAGRTKKLMIGALVLIVVAYVGSSKMESGAKKAKPKLDTAAAAAAVKPGGATKPAAGAPAVGAPAATGVAPVGGTTSSVPTTLPWVPSNRNPFIAAAQG